MENLYEKASNLEDILPGKALAIYKRLEHNNCKTRWYTITLGILGAIVGFVGSFYVAGPNGIVHDIIVPRYDIWWTGIVSWLIWCAGICLFLSIAIKGKDSLFHCAFKVFFACAVVNAIVLAQRSIAGLLFLPLSMTSEVIERVAMKAAPVREVAAELSIRRREILLYAIGVLIFVLMLYVGILWGNFIAGIFIGTIGGASWSLMLAQVVKDPVLADLYQIAQCRCLIRIGKTIEARIRLEQELETRGTSAYRGHCLSDLVSSLFLTIRFLDRPSNTAYEKYLEEIEDGICKPEDGDEHYNIVSDNIEKTYSLMENIFARHPGVKW